MRNFVDHIGSILTTGLALYALVTGVFLISENRRPQETMAWMLAFVSLPGIGLLAYVLFGRDRKAFAKQRQLMRQDLDVVAKPFISQILSRQDAKLAQLENDSASHRKLMIRKGLSPREDDQRRFGDLINRLREHQDQDTR